MTAVVGLLNKRGIAIAADSAVTRDRGFNHKVTKNGNKMIRLSNCVPISVMLTGNGAYLRTQWDILVRHYRQHRGDVAHETVEACAHDFFKYIADNHLFCEEEIIKSFVANELDFVFSHASHDVDFKVKQRNEDDDKLKTPKTYLKAFIKKLRQNRGCWEKSGKSEQFKDYTLEQFRSYVGDMLSDYLSQKEYDDIFDMNSFPKEFLDALKEDLELTWLTRLTTRRYHDNGSAELVFSGFGNKQEYPSLVSAVVFEGFDDRVNYHIRPEDIICISDARPSAICPFAQKDITRSLLRGLHTDYSENVLGEMRSIYDPFMSEIFRIEEGEEVQNINIGSLNMKLREIKVNDIDNKFCNAAVRYLDKNQRKWEKNLKDYDLLAMAALAQSLIALTGFHRTLTFQEERVGGPVDLAVISKTEGFTWLSRKSWYHHKDIGGQYGVLGV